MYSGYAGTLTVLDAAGQEVEFDPGELFAQHPRAELDWTTHVVDHLCAEVDGAAAVSIVQGRRAEQVIPCP